MWQLSDFRGYCQCVSPKFDNSMPSLSASKSSSAMSTSTATSQVSQSGTTDGQRPRGSFVGLSTAARTPESAHIPAADQWFSGLRLLAEVSTSQSEPFEAVATHTKPPLLTMTITDNLPALYHFLLSLHDFKGHHSRSMMLSPSRGKHRVLIRPISGL